MSEILENISLETVPRSITVHRQVRKAFCTGGRVVGYVADSACSHFTLFPERCTDFPISLLGVRWVHRAFLCTRGKKMPPPLGIQAVPLAFVCPHKVSPFTTLPPASGASVGLQCLLKTSTKRIQ